MARRSRPRTGAPAPSTAADRKAEGLIPRAPAKYEFNYFNRTPFVGGDKRTAMLAGLTLLEINTIRFNAEPGEIEDVAVKVATKRLDVPSIAAWLLGHTHTS